ASLYRSRSTYRVAASLRSAMWAAAPEAAEPSAWLRPDFGRFHSISAPRATRRLRTRDPIENNGNGNGEVGDGNGLGNGNGSSGNGSGNGADGGDWTNYCDGWDTCYCNFSNGNDCENLWDSGQCDGPIHCDPRNPDVCHCYHRPSVS